MLALCPAAAEPSAEFYLAPVPTMLGNSTRVGADWSVVVCPGSVVVCPDWSVVRWFAQITVGGVSNPSLTPGAFPEDAQLPSILEPWTKNKFSGQTTTH